MNVLFLCCNRASVAESLAMVPGDERKPYEYLLTYRSHHPPEVDIAWSDAFLGAAAWLADRERNRIAKEKNKPRNDTRSMNSGNFQFEM